ncbi:Cys-tRNA(Pro) deacylase [Gordonia sp. SID5947]|uniref:aminoacyl-tRNA deacylase n=1 Tax=Gordonia sp. SID5947 TaxID=2690315 RepID=UPI00136E9508|nr:aminoacyl-tRNA deacylase [Gordonia sp. SID5947]MYR08916.1 Cys-tRNA(Pro) deacylase [Gordonia sp. SID5947]
MAATPAVTALERAGIAHTVHRYPHDPRSESYGDEAVAALADTLGIHAGQVFKTLVIDVGGTLAVAIVPVPRRLSLKAAAAALSEATSGGTKARMADERSVTRSTGYVLGGVSPIGQRSALPTVVDRTALDWPEVFCSAGRRGLEVSLAPADLISVTRAVVADVAI